MIKKLKQQIFYLLLFSLVQSLWASETKLPSLAINVQNKEQLQRGAKLFMNYCSGCHSIKYLRYNRMAEDLGLVNAKGQVDKQLLANLHFTQASLYEPIQTALPVADAKRWFGVIPPDLSLITKERGTAWIYNYLKSFYTDNSRPFGVNNLLSPNAAMPNVLESITGQMKLNSGGNTLFLAEHGSLTPTQTDEALSDLITFLVYVSEPTKLSRTTLGIYVIIFLGIMLILSYGLKTIYWRRLNN